ncbi:hypothetical protein D021_1150A, partial [Vibrio parahaemolyticus 10296]|jgi:hypothetical protein
MLFH